MEAGRSRRRRRSVSPSPPSRYGYAPCVGGRDTPSWCRPNNPNIPRDMEEFLNRPLRIIIGSCICNKRVRIDDDDALRRQLPEAASGSGHDDCAICLRKLAVSRKEKPTPCRAMPCGHAFHERCIFRWVRRKRSCPLCRHALPTSEDSEELPEPKQEDYEYHDDDRLQRTMPVPREMLDVEVL